jgi:hypothetical protein
MKDKIEFILSKFDLNQEINIDSLKYDDSPTVRKSILQLVENIYTIESDKITIDEKFIGLVEEFSFDEALCTRKQVLSCLNNLLKEYMKKDNNNKLETVSTIIKQDYRIIS